MHVILLLCSILVVMTSINGSPLILEPRDDGSVDVEAFLEALAQTSVKRPRSEDPTTLYTSREAGIRSEQSTPLDQSVDAGRHHNASARKTARAFINSASKRSPMGPSLNRKRADSPPAGITVPLLHAAVDFFSAEYFIGKSNVRNRQNEPFYTIFDTASPGYVVPSLKCTPANGCEGPCGPQISGSYQIVREQVNS